MQQELALFTKPLVETLKAHAVDWISLSETHTFEGDEEFVTYVVTTIGRILNNARVSYNDIRIEIKSQILKPVSYNLVIECQNKIWLFESAVYKKRKNLDIFFQANKYLEEVLEYHAFGYKIVFAHLHHIDQDTYIDNSCEFAYILLNTWYWEQLFSQLKSYNFHEGLLVSNSHIFLNNTIHLNCGPQHFNFEPILDYKTFHPPSYSGKTIEELMNNEATLTRFEENIVGKLGLVIKENSYVTHWSYKLIVEVMALSYPDPSKLHIYFWEGYIHLRASSLKHPSLGELGYKISQNLNGQELYGELNSIMSELGLTKRIFSYNYTHYYLNDIERGFYLIDLFNKVGSYDTPKKSPDRLFIYFERQRLGTIKNYSNEE